MVLIYKWSYPPLKTSLLDIFKNFITLKNRRNKFINGKIIRRRKIAIAMYQSDPLGISTIWKIV